MGCILDLSIWSRPPCIILNLLKMAKPSWGNTNISGSVGTAHVAVLEWHGHSNYVILPLEWLMWLCRNGSTHSSDIILLAVPVFAFLAHIPLNNPLFWGIFPKKEVHFLSLSNQNIPLFCGIYFWEAILKNIGGCMFVNPWEFGMGGGPSLEVYY